MLLRVRGDTTSLVGGAVGRVGGASGKVGGAGCRHCLFIGRSYVHVVAGCSVACACYIIGLRTLCVPHHTQVDQ